MAVIKTTYLADKYSCALTSLCTKVVNRNPNILTAAWLAQLVERRTAVREVVGLNPRPDQHSGS